MPGLACQTLADVDVMKNSEGAIYDAQDRPRERVMYSHTDQARLYQRADGETLETFTYNALDNPT